MVGEHRSPFELGMGDQRGWELARALEHHMVAEHQRFSSLGREHPLVGAPRPDMVAELGMVLQLV